MERGSDSDPLHIPINTAPPAPKPALSHPALKLSFPKLQTEEAFTAARRIPSKSMSYAAKPNPASQETLKQEMKPIDHPVHLGGDRLLANSQMQLHIHLLLPFLSIY